ncbi:MAG: alpha/beta fold hydrolase [Rubricoccaceae bacterium]
MLDVSFPRYVPPRRWRGGHRQTIWPSLFRTVEGVTYERERLELADGDFLDLDWMRAESAEAPVAIVAHGLEGSSDRAYVRGLVRAIHRRGWSVVAWNLRGCSGEPNRLLRTYHSGVSDDLDAVVRHVLTSRVRRVAVLGFSLGGNVTLKWLGEQGEDVDDRIVAGVGISVPVDLAGSARAMEGLSRRLYMVRFLRSLTEKVHEKAMRFPGEIELAGLETMRTFAQFDGQFTAPIHGFASAEDYWARASSLPLLSEIRVPTLLVNALDDPFLSPSCYPTEIASSSTYLTLLTPRWGGHVGFMTTGEEYWSETVAAQFLEAARVQRAGVGPRGDAT